MSDPLLVGMAEDVISTVSTPDTLRLAERDGWAPAAWAAVAAVGLPWISVPETAGGQGGNLLDALAVLRVAGRQALPLPLAETGVLAGWLLAGAGLEVAAGPTTVVPGTGPSWDGRIAHGVAEDVAWGHACERVVSLLRDGDDLAVAAFDRAELRVERHTNLAGEPRDTVHFDGVAPTAVAAASGVDEAALALRGALTRVVLMSGALQRVLALTVRYTSERHQFGRPVARFQAVQEHLVRVAQEAAKVELAADLAADALAGGGDARLAVWSAKIAADAAARIAARAAHQAHGAMGMTQEYPLHDLTRRLWAWSREYGPGARIAADLGAQVVERGADALWPAITSGRW